MKCDIYKSGSVKNTYLFVPAGTNPHKTTPSPILKQVGELAFLKSVELEENSPLIAANPKEVIGNIQKKGFHLQSSEIKVARAISEAGAAIGGGILAASLGLGPIGAIAGAIIGAVVASSAKGGKNDPDA